MPRFQWDNENHDSHAFLSHGETLFIRSKQSQTISNTARDWPPDLCWQAVSQHPPPMAGQSLQRSRRTPMESSSGINPYSPVKFISNIQLPCLHYFMNSRQ